MRRYIVLALWLAIPLATQGAELGKLTVLSQLGQPLNAEIQVASLVAGEDDDLVARLASPEAFSKAGIAVNPALANLRLAIDRRGDGLAILRVTSAQPINEPFLDVLVEIQSKTGRIMRQYTFLLDPPNYAGQPVVAAAAPAEKPAEAPAPTAAAPEARAPEAAPAPTIVAAPAPAAAPAAPAGQFAYKVEVQKGETLAGIARQYLPDGMTLNQMLFAIYRANPDAFIRHNVNLVRAGRILTIPGDVAGVDAKEANRVIHQHIAEFAEYRRQLAAAPVPAAAESEGQATSGRIEPAPAAPPAATQDQLRLAKAEPGKPGAPAARAARADDRAALARAIEEEESRARELTKNVADLQKLVALKDKQLAELQKGAPPPAAAVPAVAKAPNAPAEKAATPPAKAATPPAEKKPLALKKAPPATQEAGILDEFLNSPLNLGLLGLVLLLLVGYGWWTWRKKKGAGGLSFHLGR